MQLIAQQKLIKHTMLIINVGPSAVKSTLRGSDDVSSLQATAACDAQLPIKRVLALFCRT